MFKRHWTSDKMMEVAGPMTIAAELNEYNHVMEVADLKKPVTSPEHGPRAVEVVRKSRKAMCSTCSFHNLDFQKLADEYKLTYGQSFLDSVDSMLSDVP